MTRMIRVLGAAIVACGAAFGGAASATGSRVSAVSLVGTPPAKPEGDEKPGGENPPAKPGGDDQGGGSDDAVVLSGAWQFSSGTNTLIGTEASATLASTNSDENVILAQTNGTVVSVSRYALNKSGDCTSEDNANFFAVNAVVAAKSGATVCLDNAALNANAKGANGLFASGSGSTIYANNCTITSTANHSRGLDATYGGTVIGSKLTIDTKGAHCASIATDRGNGSISVTESTLATAGNGSPLIYSTGAIEVNGVTGTATGAQIAGIEGLSTIRIRNSNLSGSGEKASEPVANGVIIYQSNSGDSTEGTATFEVSDSTLASAITNGALFYVTHSAAFITVRNTELAFDADCNYLLKAAGNDSNGWGTAGSNGGDVVLTAIDQTLKGTISVDGISSNDLYLVNSTYIGTFEKDTTNEGDGGANLFIDADSTWIVTSNCTLKSLTVAAAERIKDGNGASVSIVNAEDQTLVPGTSALKVTVSDYTEGEFAATNITAFTISRTAFEALYGTSEGQEGESGESGGSSGGGAQDHNNWTNYFKPHPPENAIVKVKVDGATDYGTPDRDHKYCLDGYWDGGAEGVKVRLLYVTQGGYLFADGGTSNVWETTVTNNAQEVYPPEDVVAIKAQAKCGSTDYLTLKAAVDAAKSRARITLYGNVTLEEPLTATNSITLDLAANGITLGSALTNTVLHFTAGGTVSNGTINSTLAANAAGSALLRFTDCKATLKDLTINGAGYETVIAHDSASSPRKNSSMTCDGLVLSGNGCLLSVDRAAVTLTNDCAFTIDTARTSFGAHEAAIYCTSNGTVSILGGSYAAPTVLLSEDFGVFFKSDAVIIVPPEGYVWENGRLVEEASVEPIAPGEASEPYEDAIAATNAAAKINADKVSGIAVPAGVEESARAAYLAKVEATVTSDNRVVVGLTSAAEGEVQGALDEAVTNETAVAALTSADASAKVALATTTPGLYYWIEGGTDVSAVTNAGEGVLSTDGGSVELTKPILDATRNRAFFRLAAGVSAPAQPTDD